MVYAVEQDIMKVQDAFRTKVMNNITNVAIIHGKFQDHLGEVFAKIKNKPLIIVLDPPNQCVGE